MGGAAMAGTETGGGGEASASSRPSSVRTVATRSLTSTWKWHGCTSLTSTGGEGGGEVGEEGGGGAAEANSQGNSTC